MKRPIENSTFSTMKHWYSIGLKLIFEGILIGIFTGFAIVLFRYSIEKINDFYPSIFSFLKEKPYFIPILFIILISIGIIIGLLIKAEPMVRGSGIPQIEGVLLRKTNMVWWRILLGKLFGGILAIGAGLSLGREGPSVQIGASIGQGFSKIFKRIKIEENFLITSGASAGLAAAFNAPLAGVIFALEEVHKSFSSLILLSAVSASVTADFISSGFFGIKPIFNFKSIETLPLKNYPYLLIVGAVIGLFGAFFNYSLLKVKDLYVRQKFVPIIVRPVIPLIFAGILGFFYPQVLGGGNTLVTSLTQNNFGIKLLFILLVLKFAFTIFSYGSGAPGGIFLPLLVVGAITGNLLGIFFNHAFNLNPTYINNFIVLAMAGYFAAIVKAPITGIVLITEMTGSFNHLLSLSIVVFVSYFFANLVGSKPIYESLLNRSLQNEEYAAFVGEPKTRVVLEIPISIESEIEGHKIKDICWPQGCLLVSIKRGAEEIIPKGETIIYPGDYLIVLTNEEEVGQVMEKISEFSQGSKIKTYYKHELFFHKIIRFFKNIFKK